MLHVTGMKFCIHFCFLIAFLAICKGKAQSQHRKLCACLEWFPSIKPKLESELGKITCPEMAKYDDVFLDYSAGLGKVKLPMEEIKRNICTHLTNEEDIIRSYQEARICNPSFVTTILLTSKDVEWTDPYHERNLNL